MTTKNSTIECSVNKKHFIFFNTLLKTDDTMRTEQKDFFKKMLSQHQSLVYICSIQLQGIKVLFLNFKNIRISSGPAKQQNTYPRFFGRKQFKKTQVKSSLRISSLLSFCQFHRLPLLFFFDLFVFLAALLLFICFLTQLLITLCKRKMSRLRPNYPLLYIFLICFVARLMVSPRKVSADF